MAREPILASMLLDSSSGSVTRASGSAPGARSSTSTPTGCRTDAPQADLILITHGHYDHFSPQDVERLSDEHTWLIGPPAVAERVSGRVNSIAPGRVLEDEHVRGVDVTAVAAYNTSKRDARGAPFHPREAGCVGYDLNVRGERLYHSGDTDVIPEMDSVTGVDVALLPVSGVYVMTARRGGRGRAPDPAAGGGARCTGASTSGPRDARSFAEQRAGRGADHGEERLMADQREALRRMAAEEPELAARLVLMTLPAAASRRSRARWPTTSRSRGWAPARRRCRTGDARVDPAEGRDGTDFRLMTDPERVRRARGGRREPAEADDAAAAPRGGQAPPSVMRLRAMGSADVGIAEVIAPGADRPRPRSTAALPYLSSPSGRAGTSSRSATR